MLSDNNKVGHQFYIIEILYKFAYKYLIHGCKLITIALIFFYFYFKECSCFMFEKKIADKLHKPRRREIVTEILKKDVKFLTRFKHPKLLKVIHPLEECK